MLWCNCNDIKLSKINNVELFSIKRYLFNKDEYTSTDTTNIFIRTDWLRVASLYHLFPSVYYNI